MFTCLLGMKVSSATDMVGGGEGGGGGWRHTDPSSKRKTTEDL